MQTIRRDRTRSVWTDAAPDASRQIRQEPPSSHDSDHLTDLPSPEQPDDPGRKRIYCSRAYQQATFPAHQRTSATGNAGCRRPPGR
jgi:hypothetical protein